MSLYSRTTDKPARLLCVFAHPDDEVFCAGETLARWVATGGEAMVFSATRGEAGQIQDAHAATRSTLGAVREQELREACARLGVQHVQCLDYQDGALQEVGAATLAQDVAACIRAFTPDVVITFGPDGGYGHPDHSTISAATTLACHLIAHEGSRAPQLYYSAFPQQHRLLSHHLAHWLSGSRSDFRGSSAFVRALTLLAQEATMLRYADDAMETQWFPAGFSIVEQGERATSLYLIVSGQAEVIREDADGTQHVERRLGPGQFFGEQALASEQTQQASVVALDTVTCLVLSAQAPTAFDGRGTEARLGGVAAGSDDTPARQRFSEAGVSPDNERKLAALAAHRTQFAVDLTLFPVALLHYLLGDEYFERVSQSPRMGVKYPVPTGGTYWSSQRLLLAASA
jgi:LmbE family N-acetylglucosaminyl deacetylase